MRSRKGMLPGLCKSKKSPFNKKDPKLSKKRIIRATDVELKSGGTMTTE